MITLRSLADSQKQLYTLDQWIELAKKVGINTDPDAEIDANALSKIRAFISQATQEQQAEKDDQVRKEVASKKSMERLINNNYIFVDLSCLLVPAAEKAFRRMAPILVESSKKINVPESVITELSNVTQDYSDKDRCSIATESYNMLAVLSRNNLLTVRRTQNTGGKNSNQDIISMCSHFRMQASLLVITQDQKLAADLITLNSQRSANGKPITVKKINKYGYLSNTIDKPKASKPFSICTVVRSGNDKTIPIDVIPGTNDCVYTSPDKKGEIILSESLGSGGEGTIYRTNTPYVAKIYKKECCTEYRFEKISKMIKAQLKYERICFPLAVLYNRLAQPVGYFMQKAEGYSIQSSIFRKQLFLKKLPGWKKEDLVQCAITILFKIKYLHDNNILIGDINPNNFLVVSPTEVYLVDTDSFQLDDLPCPVGFPLFTAPEIHMKHKMGIFNDYSDLLRTKENEYFAVATLIFMLMMPGKPPYTQQGGEDIIDNILEMHFPYAVGERRGENVPDGTWRFIWSHLTRRMKENFLRVFDKAENNSDFNISERLSVEQWKNELLEYQRIIQMWKKELSINPLSLDLDPLSLELYPTRLKHQPGKQYVICKGEGCEKEYAIDDPALKSGYCPECQRKGTPTKCWYDGKEFTFTNFEKYHLKMRSAPLLCPDCRKTKDEIVYSSFCAVPGCSNRITYNKGELAFANCKASEGGYKFEFPKMCKECKRKGIKLNNRSRSSYDSNAQQRAFNAQQRASSSDSSTSTRTSSGFKGCFITTAVCSYLGKPDDCEELTSFRLFRDSWLINQPDGKELIEEYYRIAPTIVRKMRESPEYESICNKIWNEYLVPCYQMILGKQFKECKSKYIEMVQYLKSELRD